MKQMTIEFLGAFLRPRLDSETAEGAGQPLLEYFASLGGGAFFWLAIALITPSLLPKESPRFAVFAVALSIALLPGSTGFIVLLASLTIIGLKYGVKSVAEGHAALVTRLGKYSRTLSPGINVIIPGLEQIDKPSGLYTYEEFKLVDTGGPPPLPAADVSLEEAERIRERSIKVKKVPLINTQGHVTLKESILNPGMRDMICSDNSVIFVNPIVFFQITDPELAAYEVNSLGESLLAITETVLRQEVGRLDGDSVISSREVLGAKLQEHLRIATEPWGARIVRVEIQDITFGNDVQEKLTKAREAELEGRGDVATAERDRDAVIARAEGQKRAKELAAEAEFRAAQLTAEGDYLLESRKREGEAAGNKAVAESLMNTPDAMVMIQAFKSQEEVAMHLGQSEGLIVLPEESAGLIGALAATVKSYSSTKLTDKQ